MARPLRPAQARARRPQVKRSCVQSAAPGTADGLGEALVTGADFYDDPVAFERYREHREWPLNPNAVMEEPVAYLGVDGPERMMAAARSQPNGRLLTLAQQKAGPASPPTSQIQ